MKKLISLEYFWEVVAFLAGIILFILGRVYQKDLDLPSTILSSTALIWSVVNYYSNLIEIRVEALESRISTLMLSFPLQYFGSPKES